MDNRVYFKRLQSVGLVGLGVACLLNGCSISNSVGSTSDSAGSMAKSSESSSGSSKSSSEKDAKASKYAHYENEAQDFAVTYLRTNPSTVDKNSFMKGISEVASQHGIVDWEANPNTYRAIGKGLKKVNLSGQQLEAYKQDFTQGDKTKLADLQLGYNN